jgi:hypothetical protein
MNQADELRAGGFSEEKIAKYMADTRQELKEGGYSDERIDSYFAQGVEVPEQTPQAVQGRIENGAQAKQRERGILGAITDIPEDFNMFNTPEGRGRLWNAAKSMVGEMWKGTKDALALPHDAFVNGFDPTDENDLDRAMGLGMLIGTSRPSKLTLTGRTSGIRAVPWGERPYVWDPAQQKAVKTPKGGYGQGDYDPGAGVTVSVRARTPDGAVHEQPIIEGQINSQHVNDAAKAAVGDQPPNLDTAEKIRRAHMEQGKLPAETAIDASRDPIKQQQLLSKDKDVPPEGRDPPEPPEAGTPGSFTTAKGSEYQIHGDGTTTRNKAARLDPGHEGDSGWKPRSEKTFYVDEGQANRLAPPADAAWRAIDHEDGTISIAVRDPKTGRWGISPSQRAIEVTLTPEIGKVPVELWGEGTTNGLTSFKGMHPGNPITEVRTAEEPVITGKTWYQGEGGPSKDGVKPSTRWTENLEDAKLTAGQDGHVRVLRETDLPEDVAERSRRASSLELPTEQEPKSIKRVSADAPAEVVRDQARRAPELTAEAHVSEPPTPEQQALIDKVVERARASEAAERGVPPPPDAITRLDIVAGFKAAAEAGQAAVTPEQVSARAHQLGLSISVEQAKQAIPPPPKAAVPPAGVPPVKPPSPPAAPATPGAPRIPMSLDVARQLISDRVSIGERTRWWQKIPTLRQLYTNFIDELHPIQNISKLPSAARAYVAARLTRGTMGKVDQFLNYGTFDFDTLKNNGRPLKQILEEVADADKEDFGRYILSKRALEVAEPTPEFPQGREPGVNLEAAQTIVDQFDSKFGKTFQNLVAYQNRVLEYLKKSGVLSDEQFAAIVQATRNYVPLHRLLAPEERTIAGRTFGPQSPLKRLLGSERKIVDPLESILRNTYSYLDVAERNAAGVQIIDALQDAGYNVKTHPPARVMDPDLIQYLRDQGVTDPVQLADFLDHSLPDKPDVDALSAMRDGRRISVDIDDPNVVQAFRSLNRASVGMIAKLGKIPASALRAGAVLTPDFMARNLMRDFLTAMINVGIHPGYTIKGLGHAIARDATYERWVKSGGANATVVSIDRSYLQENLSSLNAKTGLMERGWNVIKYGAQHPIQSLTRPLRMLSELSETATRLGAYEKVLRDIGGPISKEAMQQAGFASREATVDFARSGAKTHAYNMITAFGNAQIQGVDRAIRAFGNPLKNPKQFATTSMRIGGGITLPSVLLWWAQRDDKRLDAIPRWQKDLFWNIGTHDWKPISEADAYAKPPEYVRQLKDGSWEFDHGVIYRIPKPFELGVIFGSGPERLLDAMYKDDPKAFKDFDSSVIQALLPGYVPTLFQPVVEQAMNRSTFTDRTLIPAYLEKRMPEYEATPYTTETMKTVAKLISSIPGMRETANRDQDVTGAAARAVTNPILMENYIREWTGGLGVYAMQAADAALRSQGIVPDPVTPTPTLADIPFVKAFVVRNPSANFQPIQDFFDDFHYYKKFRDTYQSLAKEGDQEGAQRVLAIGGDEALAMKLDGINKSLTNMSKTIRDVYKDPGEPGQDKQALRDQKRQVIDQIYFNMLMLAREGNRAMDQAQEQIKEQKRQSKAGVNVTVSTPNQVPVQGQFPEINMQAPTSPQPEDTGLVPAETLGTRG